MKRISGVYSGVTEHALSRAHDNDAPIREPTELKRLYKAGELEKKRAKYGKIAFVDRDRFVYVTDKKCSVLITVLSWRKIPYVVWR